MRNLQNLIRKVREHIDRALRFHTVYWATVDAINPGQPKPLTVTRTWRGEPVSLDCYAAKRLVELYQSGELAVGGPVLVAFVDGDPMKPIVLDRIHATGGA